MASGAARDLFGPQWLTVQLTRLLPSYPDARLCVALSGGVDSTALLAALARARKRSKRSLPALRAVHIDHGLHPNASKWSAHCEALTRSLGVALEILAVNAHGAPGESPEAAARDARYAALADNLRKDEILLTGHHLDDQLETVLLQLFRGSGIAGIAAMPQLTRFAGGSLCRPLLTVSRDKVLAWARVSGLSWVEDDSNTDEAFDRNYLRRQILPLIRQRWPGVGAAVARSARHAAEGLHLLEILARDDVDRASDGDSLQVPALRALAPDRRRNALRFWIARSGNPVPDTRRLDEIGGPLLDARSDAKPRVAWNGICVQRDGGRLFIRTTDSGTSAGDAAGKDTATNDASTNGTPTASATGQAQGAAWHWRTERIFLLAGQGEFELRQDPRGPINLAALPEPLLVTTRRGGERLRLHPGGPRRALKSLLQEAHVPVFDRSRMPLIYGGARLLAAGDLWCDESIRARPDSPHRGRIFWRR